jgi:hypothetical protein
MSSELLQHSLLYGVVLSLVMSITFLTLMVISPEMWVNDYPPDIREKFGTMSEKAQKLKKIAGLPVLLFIFGIVALAMGQWAQTHPGPIAFSDLFISTFLILTLFNLVDLVILDWLIFVTIQPSIIILPGTEGAAGYKDYAFHFFAFLKGMAGSIISSAIIAGLVVLVQN